MKSQNTGWKAAWRESSIIFLFYFIGEKSEAKKNEVN